MKNRSRVEILYDIITSARTVAKKTHLMYKSNLSFKQLDLYLNYILENGLLEERLDEDGSRTYFLTNRGTEFLGLFEHLQTFFPHSRLHEVGTANGISSQPREPIQIEAKQTFAY